MANLPTAADYGQRQSLDVRRMDQATTSGSDIADALIRSASAFDSVLKEKKNKQDRLSYALARNELQTADLDARTALAEDQDWQTHDEKYSTAYKDAADEIINRAIAQGLSPDDVEILGSESNLISSQGRVDVGGNARKIEVMQGAAAFRDSQYLGKKNLERAEDGATRNNIILGQLDLIESAEESGFLKPEEAAIERQTMTQDFALSAIKAMPDEEKIRVLEATLRYRRAGNYDFGEYTKDLVEVGIQNGLPPEFMDAWAMKESSKRNDAVSPLAKDPAVGILQLRTAAAEEMGVEDRTNVRQNLEGGAGYLLKQLKRFDGDKAKALAAYNMGAGNLLEVMDKHGEEWLSAIGPGYYEETKNYVEDLLPVWEENADFDTKADYGSGQGPLTAEAIRNGEGTGFVSDFLDADTAAVMLDQAKKVKKENNDRELSQNAVDEAWKKYPHDYKARTQYIKELNLPADARKMAETDHELLTTRESNAKIRENKEFMQSVLKDVEGRDNENLMGRGEIQDTEAYAQLDVQQQKVIDSAIDARIKEQYYAEPGQSRLVRTGPGDPNNHLKSYEDFAELPKYPPPNNPEAESQATVDLTSPEWRLAFDEKTLSTLQATQQGIQAEENIPAEVDATELKRIVDQTLTAMGYTGAKRAEKSAYLQMQLESRVHAEQGKTKPPTMLGRDEVLKIWGGMQSIKGDVEDWIFDNEDESWFDATPEEMDRFYLDPEPLKGDMQPAGTYGEDTPYAITVKEGEMSRYQFLVTQQRALLGIEGKSTVPADKKALARAYFAMENGFSEEEVQRRLRGE